MTQQVLGVKLAGNCIATLGCWVLVYCNMGQLGGRVSVSQYTKCIVTGEAWAGECIVTS